MKIVKYPSKFLTTATVDCDVSEWNDSDLPSLVVTMKHILRQTNGLALAANQVGLPWRFFILNEKLAAENSLPQLIINPRIVVGTTERVEENEGCLSFPDVFLPVKRMTKIKVLFFTLDDRMCVELDGLISRVFQHEIEHLDGLVFTRNVDKILAGQVHGRMRRMKGGF